jgi:hypothetical protein
MGGRLAQPPVIGFALQVQAIVASVWRVYFHTLPLFRVSVRSCALAYITQRTLQWTIASDYFFSRLEKLQL